MCHWIELWIKNNIWSKKCPNNTSWRNSCLPWFVEWVPIQSCHRRERGWSRRSSDWGCAVIYCDPCPDTKTICSNCPNHCFCSNRRRPWNWEFLFSCRSNRFECCFVVDCRISTSNRFDHRRLSNRRRRCLLPLLSRQLFYVSNEKRFRNIHEIILWSREAINLIWTPKNLFLRVKMYWLTNNLKNSSFFLQKIIIAKLVVLPLLNLANINKKLWILFL